MTVTKTKVGYFLFDVVNHLLLLVIGFVMLYPFLYTLSASLSDPLLVMQNKIVLFPRDMTLDVYQLIFSRLSLGLGFRNTTTYTALGTVINLVLTIMLSYSLSRRDLPFRRFFTLMFLFTMYFSGGMIPQYLLVRALGLIDTIWAMVLPPAISFFNCIIMRTFFMQIPQSLSDSAKMDGANDIQILVKLIVPLSSPVIATIGLFYAVQHWNSWFPALIYLNDAALHPLQLMVRNIVIEGTALAEVTAEGFRDALSERRDMEEFMLYQSIKYATIFVTALPIILVYPFLQRYFVKGVMLGSLKY